MTTQIIDSDRRCPFDGKRLLVEIGQNEDTGWVEQVHFCLNCHYSVKETDHPRKKGTTHVLADRLLQLRLEGTVVPLVYDTTPFPKGEFDE